MQQRNDCKVRMEFNQMAGNGIAVRGGERETENGDGQQRTSGQRLRLNDAGDFDEHESQAPQPKDSARGPMNPCARLLWWDWWDG
jgi:hypothetical protein